MGGRKSFSEEGKFELSCEGPRKLKLAETLRAGFSCKGTMLVRVTRREKSWLSREWPGRHSGQGGGRREKGRWGGER